MKNLFCICFYVLACSSILAQQKKDSIIYEYNPRWYFYPVKDSTELEEYLKKEFERRKKEQQKSEPKISKYLPIEICMSG